MGFEEGDGVEGEEEDDIALADAHAKKVEGRSW